MTVHECLLIEVKLSAHLKLCYHDFSVLHVFFQLLTDSH